MFCKTTKISESNDNDALWCDSTGAGTIPVKVYKFGDRSLFLSDTGSYQLCAAQFWHLSAIVSYGDISLCHSI